jgi:hypothetical protein
LLTGWVPYRWQLDKGVTRLRAPRSSLRVVVWCAVSGAGLRDGGTSALLIGLASVFLFLLFQFL